mgnify:CR=1 FL=1
MIQKWTKSFHELLKAELNKKQDDNIQKCLISDEPLNNTKITLLCNHSFNYKYLFKEIKIQKTRFNNLETQRLKKNQIKCPYCRHTQNGILPYKTGDKKFAYVNWPEKYAYKPFKCCYIFLSGKRKNEHCCRASSEKYCKQHIRIIKNRKIKEIKNNIIKPISMNNEKIDIHTAMFLEFKLKYKNWLKNHIYPTIHHTKHYSYFKCRCQHVINKGKKTEKECSKFMICSEKLFKNNQISPTFYRVYLCNTHNYKDDEIIDKNTIRHPSNIYIDLLNIPDYYINNNLFNTYLSKYYNKYFHSNNYTYHKFNGFEKKNISQNNVNTIVYK